MLSKNKFLLAILALSFGLAGCTGAIDAEDPGYVIGNNVDNVSSLTPPEADSTNQLVIFDKTVKRIHQFDLDKMQHMKSFPVQNPEEDHFVLADFQGNYVIDLTKKGFSLISFFGRSVHNPIKFQGKPKSTAFRPGLGYLVLYDDLNSVGILKISAEGNIQNKILLGSEISAGLTIASGDINEAGKLVLALSDDSIAVVDLEQTLVQKTWIFTRFTTTIDDISWVAPVPGQANQVFVRGRTQFALIDVNAQTVITQMTYSDRVAKLSKNRDPHAIIKSSSTSTLVYPNNGQILTKILTRQGDNVLESFLDLRHDIWYVIDYKNAVRSIYNNTDEVDDSREFKQYQLTGMLALDTKKLPAKAKIQLADTFIFALFPSELGYAVRYEVQSELQSELKYFNVKDIQAP